MSESVSRKSIPRKALSSAILSLALLLALFVPPSQASVWDDATDPAVRCAADAKTIRTVPMRPPGGGAIVTYAEIRYSPMCGTNWLRINNPFRDGSHTVQMSLRRVGNAGNMWYPNRQGLLWTDNVYAPGSTCVEYQAIIINRTSRQTVAMAGTVGWTQIC